MNFLKLVLSDIEYYDKINPLIFTLNEIFKATRYVKNTLGDIIGLNNEYFKQLG